MIGNLTLDRLRILVTIDDIGSFQAAGRRLRRGEAALALCILITVVLEDLVASPLSAIKLVPVVAREHPLASLGRPATRADLQAQVQLVLTDPAVREGPSYGVATSRPWRFVDFGRRLEFLLAGMGWCRMPEQLVASHLADGRLVRLPIKDDPAGANGSLTIYAAHLRNQPLGRAGSWLLGELRQRLR